MHAPLPNMNCYPNSPSLMAPNINRLDTDISKFPSKSILNIFLFALTMFNNFLPRFSLLIVWGGHYAAEVTILTRTLWIIEPVWSSQIVNDAMAQSTSISNAYAAYSTPTPSCYQLLLNTHPRMFPSFLAQASVVPSGQQPLMPRLMHLLVRLAPPMLLLNHMIPLRKLAPQVCLPLQRLYTLARIHLCLLQSPHLDVSPVICLPTLIRIPVLTSNVAHGRTTHLRNTSLVEASHPRPALMAILLLMVITQTLISLLSRNQTTCR